MAYTTNTLRMLLLCSAGQIFLLDWNYCNTISSYSHNYRVYHFHIPQHNKFFQFNILPCSEI